MQNMGISIFILTTAILASGTIVFAQFRKPNNAPPVLTQTFHDNYQTEKSKKKTIKLKIDNIKQGYDSMQIRTWYAYSFVDERKLILLANKNKNWTGTLYIVANQSKNGDTIEFASKKKLKPCLNLFDIEGTSFTFLDGWTCTFEIATKYEYRHYEYHGRCISMFKKILKY